ncbi:MAG: hypothetical protein QW407_06235 [Thermofilaceae archaeon]
MTRSFSIKSASSTGFPRIAHVLFSKDSLHNDSERNLSYLRYIRDDISIPQRVPSHTASTTSPTTTA